MTSFYRLWLITLAIKLTLAIWLPFSADEAYYWVWGHNLQLSYYDHPPLVAWLFWLGQKMDFGWQSVRIPAVLLGHCTLLIWNRLLSPFLDDRSRRWWLGFVSLSPFLGVGSLIVTPDLPLVFFWSLAILALLHALKAKTAGSYAALGAALGLGFCAKYHMVLFVPIAWTWILFSERRKDVVWRYIPLAVLVGLLACFPVWYWNMTHDWISFRFQLEHGLKGGPWQPSWPWQYVAGQVALIFPVVLVLALRRREPQELKWLHAFAWLPLLFFFYTSFKARVEANWPIIAYPAVLTLAFFNDPGRRWLRGTMIVWATAFLLIFSHIVMPWAPVDSRKLKTNEITKYDVLIASLDEFSPFYASSYQMASTLSYRSKRMIYKLRGMNRRDFYDFHPMSIPGSDVFYVAVEGEHPLPDWVREHDLSVKTVREATPDLRIVEVMRRR